jgi:hypothetical protein
MTDRKGSENPQGRAQADVSGSRELGGGVRRWVAHNAEDTSVLLLVVVVFSLTIADIADWIKLSDDFVGQAAVAVFCIFTLASIKRRREQLHSHSALQTQITHIARTLDRVQEQTLRLQNMGPVAELASSEIRMKLNAMTPEAAGWYFKGGSGRWQRESVLPILSGKSTREVPYRMLVLDPRDPDLCGRYARYRAKQRPENQRRAGEGNPETVRDDLLACIYAAGWYKHRTRIQAQVFLTETYSPFRYDVSDKELVITVANADSPALYASAGSWFYDYVIDEMEQAMQELPTVEIPDSGAHYPDGPSTVSGDTVKAMLNACSVVRQGGTPEPLMTKWTDLGEIDYKKLARLAFRA